MKQLVEWLKRLRTATSSPDQLTENVFRGVVPGREASTVGGTLIKLEPLGRVAPRPGQTDPAVAVLLRFLDTRQLSLHTTLLASEIGALLALASGQQVEIAMELPMRVEGSKETFYLGLGPTIDRTCRGPVTGKALSRFIDYLGRLESLSSPDLEALGAASNLQYAASILADHDLRSAYLLLVSALEVMSRSFGEPPSDWTTWDGSEDWDRVLNELELSKVQAKAIRDQLMADRQLRLKATFRHYVVESLPDSFWDKEWVEWRSAFHTGMRDWGPVEQHSRPMIEILPRNRDTLYRSLGKTYDVRSGLVHRGTHIDHWSMGIRAAAPVEPTEPLPYAVLRALLLALVRRELEHRSEPEDLPDIRLI